jgi:glycosyltransferase involved in cell wall biosynthesis
VDGGSDDRTYEIMQEYAEEYGFIRTMQKDGCNIAEGRNIAIREASNDYIVGTDGGCVLDEDWYQEMTDAFDEAEYVIGMFRPLYDNLFEKVQGKIVCSPHTVDELEKGNRGPSSRSVGFSKQAWEDAGGYPEDLYTGEDSKFNAQVMAAGYEPAIAADAFVYWRMRPTWKDFFDQFYTYGEGDAKGGNLFTHPSQKLGVSKNVWLKLQSEATILAFLALIYSLLQAQQFMLPFAAGFLGLVSIPSLYYADTLLDVLDGDGIYAFLIGLCLTQTKAWAWYLGFKKELLWHPKLFLKQITERRYQKFGP